MTSNTQKLAAQVSRALNDGDRRGLARGVRQLIDARAPMMSGWKALAQPLFDVGELDLSCRAMDLYAEAVGTPAAQVERALTYVRCSRPHDALAFLDKAGPAAPDAASNAYLRGTIALNLGQIDDARAALVRAQAIRPRSGQIFQTLSMLGSMAQDTATAAIILDARSSMANVPASDRASYFYALGKTLDDLGETAAAAAAFLEGADIVAGQRPYDHGADVVAAEAAIDGWTTDRIAAIGHKVAVASDRPIVVTGLPRSGSTLVEQILASHTAVAGGDELGRFTIVVNEIGGPRYADVAQWLGKHTITDASRTYLHLIGQRFGDQGRVIDKTLEASRYLGVLASTMPDAPIVWMRRDPLDNAWSCLTTWFLTGLPWSWSQTAMAAHFTLENRLLERWQDILGDRLTVIDYEHLVADKEREIPTLLERVGLSMETATLSPENNPRLVTTASVTQVRSPITTKAVGRGNRYARFLQPFIDAYGYTG